MQFEGKDITITRHEPVVVASSTIAKFTLSHAMETAASIRVGYGRLFPGKTPPEQVEAGWLLAKRLRNGWKHM
jgi:hypothetical protein